MKILVFSNKNIFFVDGAASNRMRGLIGGLAKRGVMIHLIVTHGYWDLKEFLFHKKYKYPKNVNIHYLGFPYHLRILKRWNCSTTIKYILLKKLKSLQEIIKFNYCWINFGLKQEIYLETILFFKKERVKVLQEVSEFPSLFISKEEYEKYLKYIIPQIDLLFLMTNDLMNFYKKITNRKSRLFHIPMTVDFNRFRNRRSILTKGHIITYVGLMNNKKDGVDILIEAFAIVKNEFSDVKLRLIGPKEPKGDYLKQQEIIIKNGLENNIEYMGKVSRDDIPDLLVNSDCLVLARPDSKQARYGFPTKLGEYLATGNSVVVTSVGEITNYLKDNYNAFIAKPNDIKSFAFKILSVLRNKKNAREIGKRGFETANHHFNSENQSENILEILNNNLNLENNENSNTP